MQLLTTIYEIFLGMKITDREFSIFIILIPEYAVAH